MKFNVDIFFLVLIPKHITNKVFKIPTTDVMLSCLQAKCSLCFVFTESKHFKFYAMYHFYYYDNLSLFPLCQGFNVYFSDIVRIITFFWIDFNINLYMVCTFYLSISTHRILYLSKYTNIIINKDICWQIWHKF